MKTLKIILQLVVLFVLMPFLSYAQDDSTSQAYWVHEDPVYPSKVADYESYCTDLVINCKKYDIQQANWITISTDDLKYFHISPIENMGDLDKSRFSLLQEKMGEEDFNLLFDNFDNCYDNHNDYIIHLDKDLSYIPSGVTIDESSSRYRKLEIWYVTPQNLSKIIALAKDFKELYEKNNSKEYYRVYRSGFGASGQYLMVDISAASASAYEETRKKNKEVLGNERDELYTKLLNTITKVEILTGYQRPDLSFTPEK